MKNCSLNSPDVITDVAYRFDSFDNGEVLLGKKKNHLPAMGWNSWNAFGSGNTEALTKEMADKFIELGLDKLGYKYLVLDDGCYKQERVDGLLSNDEVKFPSGFKALSDYCHEKGLKFGMYNDIGTNLCAGAAVGTCGHEKEDAQSYVDWGVDFLKVDNCYYLWDNATFSNAENAKYTYAPAISKITVVGNGYKKEFTAYVNISEKGNGLKTESINGRLYIKGIGTFDGTGPQQTPVGDESGEIYIDVEVEEGEYTIGLDCAMGAEPDKGNWLQVAINEGSETKYLFDGVPTEYSIKAYLPKGNHRIRFMNHRRQENTLYSYAKLLEGLNEADRDHDIIYSLCEWGKTQPQNWAKKVGDSWRILNDITFAVGSDKNPGKADWTSDYTNSVTSQYNKAVIMDEFSGLQKGWNDPDMMVIGMNGLDLNQNKTHMAMWCMMNAPLMLGIDLRRVKKGDELYEIIANQDLIALNQDSLGIQAKRIGCSLLKENFDKEYVTNNDRVDILAKPLSDGGVALSFINLSGNDNDERFIVSVAEILEKIGSKMPENFVENWKTAKKFIITDLWSKEIRESEDCEFFVDGLKAYENVTIKISAQ